MHCNNLSVGFLLFQAPEEDYSQDLSFGVTNTLLSHKTPPPKPSLKFGTPPNAKESFHKPKDVIQQKPKETGVQKGKEVPMQKPKDSTKVKEKSTKHLKPAEKHKHKHKHTFSSSQESSSEERTDEDSTDKETTQSKQKTEVSSSSGEETRVLPPAQKKRRI